MADFAGVREWLATSQDVVLGAQSAHTSQQTAGRPRRTAGNRGRVRAQTRDPLNAVLRPNASDGVAARPIASPPIRWHPIRWPAILRRRVPMKNGWPISLAWGLREAGCLWRRSSISPHGWGPCPRIAMTPWCSMPCIWPWRIGAQTPRCCTKSIHLHRLPRAFRQLGHPGERGTVATHALMESFNATLKGEWCDRHTWVSQSLARRAIFEFIAIWYNRQRRHAS